MRRARFPYWYREHFTWKRLLILAATMNASGTRPITTIAVAHEVRQSRERVSMSLKTMYSLGLIERNHGKHNRAVWWGTSNGLTRLVEETGKRIRVNEPRDGDRLRKNPIMFLRNALKVARVLREIGWTEKQTRFGMRRAPLGYLLKIIKIASKKDKPGAYAFACLRPKARAL